LKNEERVIVGQLRWKKRGVRTKGKKKRGFFGREAGAAIHANDPFILQENTRKGQGKGERKEKCSKKKKKKIQRLAISKDMPQALP